MMKIYHAHVRRVWLLCFVNVLHWTKISPDFVEAQSSLDFSKGWPGQATLDIHAPPHCKATLFIGCAFCGCEQESQLLKRSKLGIILWRSFVPKSTCAGWKSKVSTPAQGKNTFVHIVLLFHDFSGYVSRYFMIFRDFQGFSWFPTYDLLLIAFHDFPWLLAFLHNSCWFVCIDDVPGYTYKRKMIFSSPDGTPLSEFKWMSQQLKPKPQGRR